MNILLNVPYEEKDLAKQQGAKWNPQLKSWYVDDVEKIRAVSKWLGKCNIICENLYLLKKKQTCWKCRMETDVYMLATDKSYALENGFQCNNNLLLLTYVKSMPLKLSEYLKKCLYYPTFSKTINEKYFINHCSFCKNVQGDNFLHEVPKQAFYSKLCYSDSEPITYAKIKNTFGVPLIAELPYYDEACSSIEMIMHHMETGIENRASMNVNQALINQLFSCSIQEADISIQGL